MKNFLIIFFVFFISFLCLFYFEKNQTLSIEEAKKVVKIACAEDDVSTFYFNKRNEVYGISCEASIEKFERCMKFTINNERTSLTRYDFKGYVELCKNRRGIF